MSDGLVPFEPRVALASLSGESDAEWARAGARQAGAALLGGLSIDEPTRAAARKLVDRDRSEFLPRDPLEFAEGQLAALAEAPILAGLNVRSSTLEPLREIAATCVEHDAICEINAHCRQAEMCQVGTGEHVLENKDRLLAQVSAASDQAGTVSVKVREKPGVDLAALAQRIERAGATVIHVDAMDRESVVAEVAAATDLFVIANNGVRDRATTREYLAYGADAVSIGRPSDQPAVRKRVKQATDAWFAELPEASR